MPVLVQTEDRATLIFNVAGSSARTVVQFQGCLIAQFGYPNDEAIEGHPLHRLGLKPHSVFEVISSSWTERLARQNRVAFPAGSLRSVRHFVITFHDSTFECLAQSFEPKPFEDSLVREVLRELRGDSE